MADNLIPQYIKMYSKEFLKDGDRQLKLFEAIEVKLNSKIN